MAHITPEATKLIDRRAARRAAREANERAADVELHTIAAISEAQSAPGYVAPPRPAASTLTRAQQIAARREATAKQAELDAARAPVPVDPQAALASGRRLTLHELNALASQADAAIRDEATAIGKAAGTAARDAALMSLEERNRAKKMQKVGLAEAAMKGLTNA